MRGKVVIFNVVLLILCILANSLVIADVVGNFEVDKNTEDASYEYNSGKLVIHNGELTISGTSTDCISIEGDAKVKLKDLTINAASGAAISIKEGTTATITLEGENQLTSSNNYAGIEVANKNGVLANAIIEGDGKLTATGNGNAAGIGGDASNIGLTGNITINGGTIIAIGGNNGAGIGTSNVYERLKADQIPFGTITINGGNITADGNGGGAGIGGGNHSDSGKIIINGGTIVHAEGRAGGAGIGSGIGSTKPKNGTEGPGFFFADIEINGGIIKEAKSEWLGAGIGGGYECDAFIKITGGTIENAIGGNGNSGSLYQGGPGIGAGYQGLQILEITGGTIVNAQGGTGAPGIGYGPAALSSKRTGAPTLSYDQSIIRITGGTFENIEGGMFASGIGSGNGVEQCNIEITGGTFGTVKGYASSSDEKSGAAGIGSGVGLNDPNCQKYRADTNLSIVITGGDFEAIIGGWGASGVGSGANNETIQELEIDANNTTIKAYSDGTKNAIDDTKNDNNSINIQGYLMQAVLSDLVNTEGGAILNVFNYANSTETYDMDMPDSYKAFGVIVKDASDYIVKGEGGYFSAKSTPGTDIPDDAVINPLLGVSGDTSSDHEYLYPTTDVPEPVNRILKFEETEWIYDSNEHKGIAVIEGLYTDSYTIYYRLEGQDEWTEENPKITNVGSIKVDVKAESSKGYETIELNNVILRINPKEISITIDNKEKQYDEIDPELTYSFEENEIYEDEIKEQVANLKISRKEGERIGKYEITVEDVKFDNYVLKIQEGILEIKKNPEKPQPIINPKTFDNICLAALIAAIGIGILCIANFRKNKK